MSQLTAGDQPSSSQVEVSKPLKGWLRRLLGPAILVLISLCAVGLHVHAYPKISPIDEMQHIDSLFKAPAIIGGGERIGQETMREEACRGLDYPYPLPPCSATDVYVPDAYPGSGYNTASINTPVYYTATKVMAKAIGLVLGNENLVTTGRLAGGVWLAIGLLVAYAAGRRLRLSRVALTASLMVIPTVSPVLMLSATITPDAMTIMVGALAVWALLYWESRPQNRWWVLLLVSVFAIAVKQTNILILGVGVVYLLIRWIAARRSTATRVAEPAGPSGTVGEQPRTESSVVTRDIDTESPRSGTNSLSASDPQGLPEGAAISSSVVSVDDLTNARIRYWLPTAAIVAGAGFMVVLWTIISSAAQIVPEASLPMTQMFAVTSFPIGGLVRTMGEYLNVFESLGPVAGNPELALVVMRFASPLMIAGVFAAVLLLKEPRIRALAAGLVIGATFGGVALVLIGYFVQGIYFGLPDRYGYSLIPGMAICLAAVTRRPAANWPLMAVAVLAVIACVVRLLGVSI